MKKLILVIGLIFACSPAFALNLINYIPPAEQPLLATTGVNADGYTALALTDCGTGCEFHMPAGLLNYAATIDLHARVHMICEGGGLAGPYVTRMVFAPNVAGVVVNRSNTGNGGVISPSLNPADGSIIEGCYIKGSGTAQVPGIWLRARGTVRQNVVEGFGGNCVQAIATAGSADPARNGNANNWVVEDSRFINCGMNGFQSDGADANAGLISGTSAQGNVGCGFAFDQFLNVTAIGLHAAGNVACPYRTTSNNGSSIIVGSYSEQGGQPSSFIAPTVVLGGQHAAGITGTAMVLNSGGPSPFQVKSTVTMADGMPRTLYLDVGKASPCVLEFELTSNGHTFCQVWWDESGKTIQWRFGRLDAGAMLKVTTALGTQADESGAALGGGKILLNGAWALVPGANRYRYIDFKAQSDMLASQAATIANLLARVTALEAAP